MGDLLWHTRVLDGPRSRGWSVGVVLGERDPAALAEALGLDRLLVVAPDGDGWRAVAAPAAAPPEPPLAEALAADAVLRRGPGPLRLETPAGQVRVRRDARDETWVACPARDDAALVAPLAPLASALGRDPAGRFPEWVLPGRRRRFYRRVASPAALELISLRPEHAWSYLRHEGLAEVCLYAGDERDLRLRVFSRRAAGGEVATSPLAALGLLTCLRAEDPRRAARTLALRVVTGHGPPRHKSALRLRCAPGRPPELSGAVTVLGRGELVCDLGGSQRERVA